MLQDRLHYNTFPCMLATFPYLSSQALGRREGKEAFFDCGRVLFGSRVAKREAEGTVHTKHQELKQARK